MLTMLLLMPILMPLLGVHLTMHPKQGHVAITYWPVHNVLAFLVHFYTYTDSAYQAIPTPSLSRPPGDPSYTNPLHPIFFSRLHVYVYKIKKHRNGWDGTTLTVLKKLINFVSTLIEFGYYRKNYNCPCLP